MIDGGLAAPLRFEILGEVRALRNAEPVDLGPAKQRAVLAVLLLQAGRPVPTHQIVDAVWGDEPPENGANVVQKYVAGLRRVLDPDRAPRTPGELLALTGSGYVLRVADGTLDADEFQTALAAGSAHRAAGRLGEAADALRAALALWRGDALGGLTGPVFETARARLAETRATAWEKWAEIELARGRDTALIPDLARLVEEFPLREGLRAQLMIALHQGGRQAEALAVFRDAREYYLDEFGAEPGERMQEAHRKILRGEPFYAEPVDPWAEGDPSSGSPSPGGLASGHPSSGHPSSGHSSSGHPSFGGPSSGGSGPAPVPPDAGPSTPLPGQRSAPPASGPPAPSASFVPSASFFPTSGAPVPPFQPGVSVAGPPPGRQIPVGEVVAAALLPLLICAFGSWMYFVYAGLRRRDSRQFAMAGGYFVLFVIGVVFLAVDPSPIDGQDLSGAEWVGLAWLSLLSVASAIHGAVVATHSAGTAREWALREQARQFVAFEPTRARELGIGRPDLMRGFDDGGLVDLNHVSGTALAQATGLAVSEAHRIVIDRFERGPYRHPDDLVRRGLVSEKVLRRVALRLICVPPSPADMPPAAASTRWQPPYLPQ